MSAHRQRGASPRHADVQLRIADGKLLHLIRLFLKQGVLDGDESWETEAGTPQGGVISPLLANVYLNPLDWRLLESGCRSVRYADDIVILCRDAVEADRALGLVRQWMAGARLTLHPEKTRIADMTQPGPWFEYFKHACRSIFTETDGWVRLRLRSILRKRCKRKGRGRGPDHIRWPNAFFTEYGLFSCVAARAKLANPCKR